VSHIMGRFVVVAPFQACGLQYYFLSCEIHYNTNIHIHTRILTGHHYECMHTNPNEILGQLSENASAHTFKTELQI
jgi:hypothetical protein